MRSGFLDAVRGYAALTVLAAHVCQIFVATYTGPDHPALRFTATAAEFAVYAFFLLSGFLIIKSLKLNSQRNAGRIDVFDYFASRVSRIYPPLIFAIVIVFASFAVISWFDLPGAVSYGSGYQAREAFTVSPSEIIQALTMRGGLAIADGPLWSLYIEVKLYGIALGIALLTAPNSRLMARIAGAIVAALIGISGLRNNGHFIFYSSIWFAGAALAFTRLQPPSWTPKFAATGDFSYTLYVVHFPLLLLLLSLTHRMIGGSFLVSAIVGTASGLIAIVVASSVAPIIENDRAIKGRLTAIPRLIYGYVLK